MNYREVKAPQDPRTERYEKRFEVPLIVAAVLTIPATILQNTSVGEPWSAVASVLNWGIWLAFLLELVVMLAVVPNRWRYLRGNPLDLLIVVATPPFLVSLVQNLRVLRLLRLFRLLRLAPLARVVFSLDGVRAVATLALLTALAGGAGFAALEGTTFGTGLYWAVTTMTTVGDGNVTPNTAEGKALSVVVMLVGIGAATLFIGAVAQRFFAHDAAREGGAEDDVLTELHEIASRLARLEQRLAHERRVTPR